MSLKYFENLTLINLHQFTTVVMWVKTLKKFEDENLHEKLSADADIHQIDPRLMRTGT
jgi:hypothetical protein